MQLGMIGLGRMGGNIVRRLMHAGHRCVVYDKSTDAVLGLAEEGAAPSRDLADFVRQLDKPRAVWVMLPAGAITHATIVELSGLLDPADMMIGGGKDAAEHLDPIFAALAPGIGSIERTPGRAGRDPRVEQGYLYCGPAGAGHFVKMVHNGIEYGLMQAYAEGFDILRNVNSPAIPENR